LTPVGEDEAERPAEARMQIARDSIICRQRWRSRRGPPTKFCRTTAKIVEAEIFFRRCDKSNFPYVTRSCASTGRGLLNSRPARPRQR